MGNITSLQSHTNELLSLLQQLARKDDNQVGAIAHLSILLLTRHNQQLSGGVNDVELTEDGSGIRSQDHLLQVVDDDLVAAVGAQGGLDGLRDGLAGLDVPDDGSVFGIVAELSARVLAGAKLSWLRRADKEVGLRWDVHRLPILHLPLVPRLEETGLGGPGDG